MFPPQAENIMFLELDVSPPAVFEMEFSHDQEQDPRALHMERLMRLDSFLERPSTSKVRKSRSWSVLMVRVGKGLRRQARHAGWLRPKRVLAVPDGREGRVLAGAAGEEFLPPRDEGKASPRFSVSCPFPQPPHSPTSSLPSAGARVLSGLPPLPHMPRWPPPLRTPRQC